MTEILKKDKFFWIVFIFSFFALLRSLLVPLQGDEITYFKISENIINGKYFLENSPTTVTPIIPFLLAFFKAIFNENFGIIFFKLFNILLFLGGLRFLFRFLMREKIDSILIYTILILTICNPNSIAWFSKIYPESILFYCFWGFTYYYNEKVNRFNFTLMLSFAGLLFLTRYVYGILGILVLVYYMRDLNIFRKNIKSLMPFFVITFLLSLPIIFWFNYVYNVELNNDLGISYFNRYKSELTIIDNIKYGLGIGIHPLVSRVNGLPAFITLWLPITGFRSYILSSLVLLIIFFGYYKENLSKGINMLLINTLLILVGYILAGTGFSRYWLILVPSFILGILFFMKQIQIPIKWILLGAKILAIIYIINEIRLDYLIVTKYM